MALWIQKRFEIQKDNSNKIKKVYLQHFCQLLKQQKSKITAYIIINVNVILSSHLNLVKQILKRNNMNKQKEQQKKLSNKFIQCMSNLLFDSIKKKRKQKVETKQ